MRESPCLCGPQPTRSGPAHLLPSVVFFYSRPRPNRISLPLNHLIGAVPERIRPPLPRCLGLPPHSPTPSCSPTPPLPLPTRSPFPLLARRGDRRHLLVVRPPSSQRRARVFRRIALVVSIVCARKIKTESPTVPDPHRLQPLAASMPP